MDSRNENRICDLFWIKTLKGQIIFNLLGSDSIQYAKMDQFNSYAWKWNLGFRLDKKIPSHGGRFNLSRSVGDFYHFEISRNWKYC